MKNSAFLIALLWLLVSSCSPTPKPIEYGSDSCDYCKMTIVDQQHAAEAVTAKAKVFKFDAIECMLNFGKERENEIFALLLVNDFHSPRALIPAETSFYLISTNLPSPMGANLTAFKDEAAATKMQSERGGEVFDWEELKIKFNQRGKSFYSEY